MLGKIALLSLLMTICAVSSFAQEDEKKTEFNDSALPRTAAAAKNFVPPGWMVNETFTGDLNNDGTADTAVVLVEKPAAGADKDSPGSREKVLMILFKNSKGEFERIATAKDLLPCTDCGGMLGGNGLTDDIKIVKGILIISELSGSRESSETTFRFRYDLKTSKIVLIGYDDIERDRGTGASTSTSTNYLTGVRITEEFQYNEKLDKDIKKSSSQTKVATPVQPIEDVDYGKMLSEN